MNSRDRRLGLDRAISRRDFLNGISVAIGVSLLPACGRSDGSIAHLPAPYYPPGRDRDARFAPGFVRSGSRHSAGPALGGFDPAHDIAGITVNRWPHGYAYSVDAESGDVAWWPKWWRHERRPWVDARQRVGNIAFAGTDSASNAMTETAIEEAHRAIHSLGKEATL